MSDDKELKAEVKRKDSKKEKKDKKREKTDGIEKKDKKDKKEKKDKKDKKEKSDKKSEKSEGAANSSEASASAAKVVAPAPSSSAIKAFLDENSASIEVPAGIASLDPVLDFDGLVVEPQLTAELKNFKKPTPIQSTTWPYLLAGTDVVGVAETGSGKTMAFGIPAVNQIMLSKSNQTCLVVAPTRELAVQIFDTFEILLKKVKGVKAVCLYGGVPKYDQQQMLRDSQVKVVVGTPGRLRDLLGDGSLNMTDCRYLVLDEADRMLEKGFEQDIKEILSCAPPVNERQTVMFTATWPPEVRSLAAGFMRQNGVVKVSIGEVDELHANKRITQIVEVVDPRMKERHFLDVLRKYTRGSDKVLVFALYKKEASRIERLLVNKGYQVAAIHGDLSQQQRTSALQDFKTGKSSLLLATDVAARGLDIPAVKVVINLTFPLTIEDYVHRIGRTGRAGQTGTAHTLFTEQEKHLSGALMNVLRDAGQEIPEELTKFGSHTKKKEHSLYGAFFKNVDPNTKAKKIKFD